MRVGGAVRRATPAAGLSRAERCHGRAADGGAGGDRRDAAAPDPRAAPGVGRRYDGDAFSICRACRLAYLKDIAFAAFAAALDGMDESKPDSHLIHSVGCAVVCSGVTARATLCALQTLSLASMR